MQRQQRTAHSLVVDQHFLHDAGKALFNGGDAEMRKPEFLIIVYSDRDAILITMLKSRA